MAFNDIQKKEILAAANKWFKGKIALNHIKNTEKLINPIKFKMNPFLVAYLANFLTGNTDPLSVAKVLVYSRVLATSINTSFGQNFQYFTNEVFESLGSTTKGIDIEFIDQVDNRKKYCQLKAGPSTINSDDVVTIHHHFSAIRNLARTNNLKLEVDDLIVGVLYGEKNELSTHYKNIEKKHYYPVFVGQDFWHRLTGDNNFYFELIKSFAGIAREFDGTELLEKTINTLAKTEIIQKLAGL